MIIMDKKNWLSCGLRLTAKLLWIIIYCFSNSLANPSNSVSYQDGVYEGSPTRFIQSGNFWGKVKLTIENGKFTKVEFQIVKDETEIFNEFYENNYIGNPYYMQQCRNDWKGVIAYPRLLLD